MADQYASLYHEELAPKAGEISVINVNTTAASQNLQLCGPQSSSMANSDIIVQNASTAPGILNRRVSFTAVSANVGVIFGPTQASVSSGNAPNIANTGVNGTTVCYLIPSGVTVTWVIHNTTQWMGYVASGNGSLVIAARSRGL